MRTPDVCQAPSPLLPIVPTASSIAASLYKNTFGSSPSRLAQLGPFRPWPGLLLVLQGRQRIHPRALSLAQFEQRTLCL